MYRRGKKRVKILTQNCIRCTYIAITIVSVICHSAVIDSCNNNINQKLIQKNPLNLRFKNFSINIYYHFNLYVDLALSSNHNAS